MSIASEITALQTDKTNIANAITAKGGTVNSGDGYDDFATDIGTIPTAYISYATRFRETFMLATNLPAKMEIRADNLNYISSFAEGASGLEELIIHSTSTNINLGSAFYRSSSIKKMFLDFDWNNLAMGTLQSTFRDCNALEEITPTISLTGYTAYAINLFIRCYALKELRILSGTISAQISFANCSLLSDASIVSIANGLSASASSQTLTLHATPKARCSTLMGTVTDGVFTQDDTGTVSLQTFITDEKGWSLA